MLQVDPTRRTRMGAEIFFEKALGDDAEHAFQQAVQSAQYECGHGGYTGTIAEKSSFTLLTVPEGEEPSAFANRLIEEGDPRVDDKWGPAGCVKIGKLDTGERMFLFFGWASS
jgi:hypothetical protein